MTWSTSTASTVQRGPRIKLPATVDIGGCVEPRTSERRSSFRAAFLNCVVAVGLRACQCETSKVANMGRKERTKDYFRKRLKSERDRSGWSQADMAKRLSDNGIPMHSTTIAKIEAGDREVRIDEATGIADLFDVSLDALLGRKGMEDDQSHALSVLAEEAEKVLPDLMQIRERVWRAYQDLAAQWDFQSLDESVAQGATWGWSGLSLEHKRAMLAWTSRDLAMEQLSLVLAALADVVAIRSMTPPELRKRIEMHETDLAAITEREHKHGATSKGKR